MTLRGAAIVLFCFGVLYCVLRNLSGRLIYYPLLYPGGDWSVQSQLGATDRWITTHDGVRVHAWWIESQAARFATLFLHGNAGNITHRGEHARRIAAAGSSLLLLDYRGYGKSRGSPSEAGLYADAGAAFDGLIAAGYSPQTIIVHGESLGSAVAAEVAFTRGCGGVILEAPLRSAGKVAASILPVIGPALVGGFDTESKVSRLNCPLLVIHGDRDEVVPYSHGKSVFAAAPGSKWFWTVPGGHHNDLLWTAGSEYEARLKEFYSRLAQLTPSAGR